MDLNAFLYGMESNLAAFAAALGLAADAASFQAAAAARAAAIEELMYCAEEGATLALWFTKWPVIAMNYKRILCFADEVSPK